MKNKQTDNSKSPKLPRVYIFSIVLGMVFGVILCSVGLVLIFLGFDGEIEWLFETTGFKSKLGNASPGIFVCLLGFLLLWKFKPKIRVAGVILSGLVITMLVSLFIFSPQTEKAIIGELPTTYVEPSTTYVEPPIFSEHLALFDKEFRLNEELLASITIENREASQLRQRVFEHNPGLIAIATYRNDSLYESSATSYSLSFDGIRLGQLTNDSITVFFDDSVYRIRVGGMFKVTRFGLNYRFTTAKFDTSGEILVVSAETVEILEGLN